MADWIPINKDVDMKTHDTLGATFVMKVPGGMVVRNIMNFGGATMVFVPVQEMMVAQGKSNLDVWIEENKIT